MRNTEADLRRINIMSVCELGGGGVLPGLYKDGRHSFDSKCQEGLFHSRGELTSTRPSSQN